MAIYQKGFIEQNVYKHVWEYTEKLIIQVIFYTVDPRVAEEHELLHLHYHGPPM